MADQRVVFHCQTLTATFLHGADCGKNPELRAPSFKGLARYWFRALAACPDAQKLFAAEAAVFGGARKAKGASRRGVSFALENDRARTGTPFLLPHKEPLRGRSSTPGIVPDVQFRLRLAPFGLPGSKDGREALEVAAASLWVALHLGGVGQRSRRGAGHVRLRGKPHGWEPPPLDRTSPEAYARTLGAAVRTLQGKVQKWCARYGCTSGKGEVGHPSLANGARVQVRPIGGRNADEQGVRAQLMRGLRDHKSPAMGLPYMKRVVARGDQSVGGRHASPVWLTVDRLEDGRWVLVETFLPPLPRHSKISDTQRDRVIRYLDRGDKCHRAWP